MTLNGYLALKSVFGSASNGLAYSGFQTKLQNCSETKLAELRIYFRRQKCSSKNAVFASIRFMYIFEGVRWREGVK